MDCFLAVQMNSIRVALLRSKILLLEVRLEPACSAAYLTKLRYEVSASTSSGFNVRATSGIGDPGVE